uniref:Uncharacterized protein n=1 Tax=Pyrodinium bahamense TaxID=73915 RepID=A0A7S0FGH2_9DINO|mmetsp:Transcript_2883/g.8009  ORF Transcript_2883/g.8009 Transcript_2883/m.8009 type:complete len:188 (+) Transcript_2883:102-665(+)
MDWLTRSFRGVGEVPLQEDSRNHHPAPSSASLDSQEAADWRQTLERRHWEMTFKLQALSLQYEQLDNMQREQAVQLEKLTAELQESIAERRELASQLEESHEAASSLSLENQSLREAIRTLMAAIGTTPSTLCRLQDKADGTADQQCGYCGIRFEGEGRLSADRVSNASTADSSGLAGSVYEGPMTR